MKAGLTVFLATFLIMSNTWAQDKLDFYSDVASVLENKILPRLLVGLPSRERAVVERLDVIFVPNPALVTTVLTEKSSQKVYLYAGFMDGLFQYVDCNLMFPRPGGERVCNAYFDYYFTLVSNGRVVPDDFAYFVLADDEKVENWYANKQLNQARNTMFLSALVNVLAHETGHHVVGFNTRNASVSDIRELEAKVDEWAYSALHNMGENPIIGAALALGYVAQMDRFREAHDVPGIAVHPSPRSRVQDALDKGCRPPFSKEKARACDLIERLVANYE